MTEPSSIAYPEWTECIKKHGLDPLGMQNTSVGLYQALMPGISNVTLRIRYYGFYAWLSLSYAKEVGDTNPKVWQQFIRRAEALYALIAQHHGKETGVAGTDWAQKKLAKISGEIIDFSEDADPGSPTHYLKQPWGAYGAAYASQLLAIEVFSSTDLHEIPVPSLLIGEPLAAAFAAEFGATAIKYLEIIKLGSVSRTELTELSVMAPSDIKLDSNERELYQNLLFAQSGVERTSDIDRRQTLNLILSLANQLNKIPSINDVRWALYSGFIPNGKPIALTTNELVRHRQRWWVYQANDLSHICFEALLKFTLDTLEEFPNGIPLSSLITHTVKKILAEADNLPATWGDFLNNTKPEVNAWSPSAALSEYELSRKLMQAARPEGICTSKNAWLALQLLAILHNRFNEAEQSIKADLSHFESEVDAFRSLLTEIKFLSTHQLENFSKVIGLIIEERVIRRHFSVALRKLKYQRDYTFLIDSDDGRVRLRSKDGPVFTNPRLGPAITFLKDIHLINENGLTQLGQQLVENL